MSAPPSSENRRTRRSVLEGTMGLTGVVIAGCYIWISAIGVDRSNVPEWRLDSAAGAKRPELEPQSATTPISAVQETNAPESSDSGDEAIDPLDTPPPLDLQTGTLAWEAQIDAILSSGLSDSAKARQLLSQLSLMPLDACSRVAQEAVDRLPDRDYVAVALPLLINPDTNGSAEAVLYADLLERPDSIALPALLALAHNPRHSFAESAHETLTLLVGGDFGTDWKQWESAVAELLVHSQ